MHRRQVSKFVKVLIALLIYSLAYIIISFVMTPRPVYNFVSDDVRIGDKYVLIYLIAKGPTFSDIDGAEVFRVRRCGNCFITNNKGFLPIAEYDAIVVHGDRRLLTEPPAFMDPGKRYVMETPRKCLNKKLVSCGIEPKLTSFATKDDFDLCGLCRHLHEIRQKAYGYIVKRDSCDAEVCNHVSFN